MNKLKRAKNYRGLFVIGIAFIAIGAAGNPVFIAVGAVFMIIGWKNRDNWPDKTVETPTLDNPEEDTIDP